MPTMQQAKIGVEPPPHFGQRSTMAAYRLGKPQCRCELSSFYLRLGEQRH